MKRSALITLLMAFAVLACVFSACDNATSTNVTVNFYSENELLNSQTATQTDGIVLPEAPENEGYTFSGWEYGNSTYNVGDLLDLSSAGNEANIYAVWQINSYNITFVSEISVENMTLGMQSAEYGATLPTPSAEGYTFDGWFYGETEYTTVPAKDITLTAKWTEAQTVRVYFYSDDKIINSQPTYGTIILPSAPEKEGYTFSGWSYNNTLYDVGSSVTISSSGKTADVYAVWEIASYTVTYVSEYSPENVSLGTQTLEYGTALAEMPTLFEDYTFDGWFDGDTQYTTMPARDVTLTAKWTKYVIVTYSVDGVLTERTEVAGAEIFDTAEKIGYTFVGWYDSEDGGSSVNIVPQSDSTVYARFTPIMYTITYKTDNGTTAESVAYGTELTLTGLEKQGNREFECWSDGETTYTAGNTLVITGDITLRAQYIYVAVDVVLYDWDGTVLQEQATVSLSEKYPLASDSILNDVPEFAGYTYEDTYGTIYYVGKDDILSSYTFDSDVTSFTAYYVNPYTGDVLPFASMAKYLCFKLYTSGATSSYRVAARTEWNSTNTSITGEETVCDSLPDSLYLPATYNGKLVTGIPSGDSVSYAPFGTAIKVCYGEVYIPTTYSSIGSYAFYNQHFSVWYFGKNSKLRTIPAESGIGLYASRVYGFPDIISINKNGFRINTVTDVDSNFIVYDDEMNEIHTLPTTLRTIAYGGLSGCDIFYTLDLSNLTSVGENAFGGLTKCTELTIGSNLTAIPGSAFNNMDGLTVVEIPARIQSIGQAAFRYCDNLQSVTFAEDSQLLLIGDSAFFGCPIVSITIPDSVTEIGMNAFAHKTTVGITQYISTKLETLNISENSDLRIIGEGAFSCALITDLTLPSGLQTIGDYAFAQTQNLNLKFVSFPASLTYIGDYAFSKAFGYNPSESVYFDLDFTNCVNLNYIGGYAFKYNCDITGILFPTEVNLVRKTDSDGNTGDYGLELGYYAFAACNNIAGEIVFPQGTYKIDSAVFKKFSDEEENKAADENVAITVVKIPKSVVYIGGYAFANCTKLEKVLFEDNQDTGAYLTIGNAAFENCVSLTRIDLPCQLTYQYGGVAMGTTAGKNGNFRGCTSLKTVVYRGKEDGSDVDLSISSVTYEGCTALTAIYMLRNTLIDVYFSGSEYVASYYGETETSNCLLNFDGVKVITLYAKLTSTQGLYENNSIWNTKVKVSSLTLVKEKGLKLDEWKYTPEE